jgi:hypothetical protein
MMPSSAPRWSTTGSALSPMVVMIAAAALRSRSGSSRDVLGSSSSSAFRSGTSSGLVMTPRERGVREELRYAAHRLLLTGRFAGLPARMDDRHSADG